MRLFVTVWDIQGNRLFWNFEVEGLYTTVAALTWRLFGCDFDVYEVYFSTSTKRHQLEKYFLTLSEEQCFVLLRTVVALSF